MLRDMRWTAYLLRIVLIAGFLGNWFAVPIFAQTGNPADTIASASAEIGTEATAQSEGMTTEGMTSEGMTLYDLLKAGGWVMYVLMAISVLALALVLYFTVSMRQRKLVPREVVVQIRHYLRDQRYEDIARLCRRSKGMFSKVIMAGITRGIEDPMAAAATMEAVGRREADALMRKVRYLSDIATVAPMLGILGTVLGMIRAFNFIAFDISAVKPVALASAVAQALVTTAAGLIVAIPCMGFFFYFRGKLQSLIGEMEEVAVEISDQLTTLETQPSPIRRGKRKSSTKESHAQGKSMD